MADELSNAGALVVTAKERSMDSISSGSSQMVGIVSGSSLGLSSGSMTTLGQQGMRGQAASGSSGERIFVNVSNGNLVLQDMDEQLVNQQLPIELLRTYNSQGQLSDTSHGLGVSGFQQQRIELIGTLYAQAEAGRYVSPNPSIPDWGVNDINIWLLAPMAQPAHVCITNENTEYSSDEEYGKPQQFTYEQFRAALKHWREFQKLIAREGKEKLVGQRFEVAFPE